MADKTYRMTVTLSNGSTVDAGTFVAPQGPQGTRGAQGPAGPEGPQGPAGQQGASGAINDWSVATTTTVLSDGAYLIEFENNVGITYINNGNSGGFVFAIWGSATEGLDILLGKIIEGRFTECHEVFLENQGGALSLSDKNPEITNYRYIKLK